MTYSVKIINSIHRSIVCSCVNDSSEVFLALDADQKGRAFSVANRAVVFPDSGTSGGSAARSFHLRRFGNRLFSVGILFFFFIPPALSTLPKYPTTPYRLKWHVCWKLHGLV